MKREADDWDGKERRSGTDRRKGERRDADRNKGGGVLSTRKSERRRGGRRSEDRGKKENPSGPS